jgi:hypothetical protein
MDKLSERIRLLQGRLIVSCQAWDRFYGESVLLQWRSIGVCGVLSVL